MKAVTVDPVASGHLSITEMDAPRPDSCDAVVRVTAFSVNRGEIRRAESGVAGTQIGWDTVGVVESAARDGSGPPAGTRVVGFSRGMRGWAEQVALPTRDLAPIPPEISDINAATLPVAGLTALYALERCQHLLGARVLITGASGGVGYFACQLAGRMGADPVALLRRRDHEQMVRETGAEVVISADGSGLDAHGPFRAIIDGVGGPQLGLLVEQLEPGGRLILYGVSGGPESTVPLRDLMFTGDGRIEGFHLYRESEVESASRGLGRLLHLMARKQLETVVSVTQSWSNVSDVAARLIEREYPGKAVLTLP